MSVVAGSEGACAAAEATNRRRDIEELYRCFSAPLERMVRLDVRAPQTVIEDACQFAWSRLVHHADRIRRETALSWLTTTAVHEAFKLLRHCNRELSWEVAFENEGSSLVHAPTRATDELFEQRERLAGISTLPWRQQRLVWLQALGLSYAEMAAHEGYTERTVERQLLRAKRTVREDEAGEC